MDDWEFVLPKTKGTGPLSKAKEKYLLKLAGSGRILRTQDMSPEALYIRQGIQNVCRYYASTSGEVSCGVDLAHSKPKPKTTLERLWDEVNEWLKDIKLEI